MAYITHTARTVERHSSVAGPSLLSEFALTFVLPRVSAAAERLSTRDDMPTSLREPASPTRSMIPPRVDAARLWRSTVDYVETTRALTRAASTGLADLGMSDGDIGDVALVASFGWMLTAFRPDPETTRLGRIRASLASLRRQFAPTDDELDEAYLAAAQDINDLEYRIRSLDLRRRTEPSRRYGALQPTRW
jgi:uncharacterized protein YjiS (DUF1127 family)